MKLSQTVDMVSAEPIAAIASLAGAFAFFATCGWAQSEFGWYWAHAMVSAPCALFFLVAVYVEGSSVKMSPFGAACLAMIPFVVLWIVRFNIPVTTEWWERL